MRSLAPALMGLLTLAAAQLTIPEGCESVALSQTWTTFSWHNSSHNLDCANPNFPAGAEYCVNYTTSDTSTTTTAALCDSNLAPCDACFAMCTQPWIAGITDQPLGYGPPDIVDMNGCAYQNPTFQYRYEVGEGYAGCSVSAAVGTEFWGDSSVDEGGNATYWESPQVSCGSAAGGYYRPVYEVAFPLRCVTDEGGNATCTTDLPLEVPLTGFM